MRGKRLSYTLPTAARGPYEGILTHVHRAADGSVHWRATCSDDGVDEYATRMTTDLHEDFIRNAGVEGMPYLTIAHYNQIARIGRATKLYRDNRRLKAEGIFWTDHEDEFVRQLAAAAAERALEEAKTMPRLRTIRTSIGFIPYAADQENLGVMAYTRGYLSEVAMTTYPANSRADFAAGKDEEMRSLKPELMRQDAENIVGEEMASELDRRLKQAMGDQSRSGDTLEYLYRSLQDEMPRTAVATHKGRAVETDSWDGNAAVQRAQRHASPDGSGDAETVNWKTYRSFFATVNEDGAEKFGAYAFLHHDVDDNGVFVSLSGLIAAGAAASDNPDAQKHLSPHYVQFDRSAPWERERTNLAHRMEDIEDLRILNTSGLVSGDAITRAIDGLIADFPDQTLDRSGVETEFDPAKGLILRTGKLQPLLIPISNIISRVGRRLQGKKLAEMENAITTLSAVLAWAKEKDESAEGEDDKSRTYEEAKVDPAHPFRAALKDRCGYDVDPDKGLMETLDDQEVREWVFKALWTLGDIIGANFNGEAELTLEARLGNIQDSTGEFLQIVNALAMQRFGGGRSAAPQADNSSEMTQEGQRNDVKPTGADAGTVNPDAGASTRQPDLQRFDATVSELRQVIVDGDVAKIQEKLDILTPAIEDALGPSSPESHETVDLDPVMQRLGGVEIQQATILERLNDLAEMMDNPPAAITPSERPARSFAPRRRSYAPGPAPTPTPNGDEDRRQGGPMKIADVARRSVGLGSRYP